MYRHTRIFLILFIAVFYLQSDLFAFESGALKNKKTEYGKTLTDPYRSLININNLTCWVSQDGFHDWIVDNSWNGSFPINYYIGTIFCEGIVWGGKVFDGSEPDVRVNGNTYATGCAPIIRIFRVRNDYQTADLTLDAATFFNIIPSEVTQEEINQVYDQYQTDWNDWPADEGAPYEDVNKNSIYESDIDTPGVPSAAQTIFIKYDDSLAPSLYGSAPIGLEISETYWSFAAAPSLNNTIFKKVDIVYTGGSQPVANAYIDSMYICQWSDPDIGNSGDDFAGCDTSLKLGYSYNAAAIDTIYQGIGLEPPASGYIMLQGISEYSGFPGDSAIFNFKWRHGYKYSNPNPMSSFIYFSTDGLWRDPDFTYDGTLQFYNLMRGYLPDPPYPASQQFPESVADYTVSGCHLLTGDPVSGSGKIDGTFDNAGDRRILLTNGPFHMDINDTVEAVIALTAASGDNHLESITELRKNAFSADSTFQAYVKPSGIVAVDNRTDNNFNYRLLQNYPNPFNPLTKIRYSISAPGKVIVKVYGMLGNEIETLVNEEKPAGTYEVTWNASNLPSGVYFYQLKAEGFIQTKKMILLK